MDISASEFIDTSKNHGYSPLKNVGVAAGAIGEIVFPVITEEVYCMEYSINLPDVETRPVVLHVHGCCIPVIFGVCGYSSVGVFMFNENI